MGYAKYSEDIQEIKDEGVREKQNDFYKSIVSVQKKYIQCPYCNFESTFEEDIEKHIRHNHNSISTIVIINGKVLSEDLYINECYEATAICYGKEDNIYLDAEKLDFSNLKKIDITKDVNLILKKNKKANFLYTNKNFTIYKIEKEDINTKLINDIVHKWNREIKEKIRITHPSLIELNMNSAEKEIINGIYNYYIGCSIKPIEFRDKMNRYQDAYNMLINYTSISPISLFIAKIIALKFNWYETFVKLSQINCDDFLGVYDFILDQEQNESVKKEGNGGYIYIDDDLEEIIDLINLYQWKGKNYIQVIEDNDESKYDINGKDIIYWLKARMYFTINKSKSKEYYDDIVNKNDYIKKERTRKGV